MMYVTNASYILIHYNLISLETLHTQLIWVIKHSGLFNSTCSLNSIN